MHGGGGDIVIPRKDGWIFGYKLHLYVQQQKIS